MLIEMAVANLIVTQSLINKDAHRLLKYVHRGLLYYLASVTQIQDCLHFFATIQTFCIELNLNTT